MIWCIRSTGFPYFIREFLHLLNKELGIKLTKEKNDEILRCYLNQQKGEEHPEQRRKTKKKVLKKKEVATKYIQNFFMPVSAMSSIERSKKNKAIIEMIKIKRKKFIILCNTRYYFIYYLV